MSCNLGYAIEPRNSASSRGGSDDPPIGHVRQRTPSQYISSSASTPCRVGVVVIFLFLFLLRAEETQYLGGKLRLFAAFVDGNVFHGPLALGNFLSRKSTDVP